MLLSKDECLEIIKRSLDSSNFKLINFEIQKASDDNIGFLGEYYNLIAEIQNTDAKVQNLKFFIKTIPQSNLEHKKIIQEIGVFKKEEKIYKLLSEWNDFFNIRFSPKCLFSKTDVIVLEDLSTLGYYHLEDETEYTINHLKAILNALAGIHASSIAHEVKNNTSIGEQLKDVLFETSVSKDITWFLAGLEAVKIAALKHPKFQEDAYQNFISNEFLNKLYPVCDMVNASTKYKNVLCHRDVWGRNIFFKSDTNNNKDSLTTILVDYQTCRYCPPAVDILFLLHLNVRKHFRDKFYIECLRFYYEMLEKNLIFLKVPKSSHITYEEVLESCTDFKLLGVVYDSITATVLRLPKGYLPNLKKTDPKLYYEFSNVSRNNVVSKFLENDPNFKEYLFQCVEELMEIVY